MSANRTSSSLHGRGKQRGAALLILLAIILIGIAAILINSLSSAGMKNARQQKTAAVLAQAKAALIGYAITYGDTHSNSVPGFLPCPDTDGTNGLQPEGVGEYGTSSCNSSPSTNQDVSVIGRLPWATLDVSDLRDGDGECLWYAVSGTYKNNPPTGLMNWDANGQFQVYAPDGTLLASQVVAVIFAPGAALTGQDRSGTAAPICGGNYTASNYLDTGTVNSINFNNTDVATGHFIQGTSSGNINDQMVFITRDELWNAVQKRSDFQNTLIQLPKKVAQCLALYGNSNNNCGGSCPNRSLPWAAPVTYGTNQTSDYYNNSNYNDTPSLFAGRVPYVVDDSRDTSWPHHNPLTTLMNSGSCSSIAAGWTAGDDAWWNNWKDHLFYGVSTNFQPSWNGGQFCGTCLSINGTGSYAGIVIFAGQRLSGQTRTSKNAVADYLEGNNDNRIITPSGSGNYNAGNTTLSFNDIVCYITPALNVICP